MEALHQRHPDDLHFATYAVFDAKKRLVDCPPRLRKEQLQAVRDHGFKVIHTVRAADADMPEHAPITPEVMEQVTRALWDYPCVFYFTRGGARIIQLMTKILTPEQYEVSIKKWLPELKSLVPQLQVDDKCKDWTRLMRLPLVVRDGKPTHTNIFSHALQPVDPGDCQPAPKPWKPRPPVRIADGDSPYGKAALRNALAELQATQRGHRNTAAFKVAVGLGQLVGGGEISEDSALATLHCGVSGWNDPGYHEPTILRALEQGKREPRTAPNAPKFDFAALKKRFEAPAPQPDDSGDFTFDV
jgi:hypothetical protein